MAGAPPGLVQALVAAATALEGSAAELNQLDGHAGDGDLGITMTEAARAVKEVLASGPDMGMAQVLTACGAAIARKAPSTSGTLVATGFLRAAKAVGDEGSSVAVLERAFATALEGIQARGKAAVGDRTLVDGLDAVCKSLEAAASAHRGVAEALWGAADAARAATDQTVDMVPKVGRASWVPQRASGHPDAGCAMLTIALTAAAQAVSSPRPPLADA